MNYQVLQIAVAISIGKSESNLLQGLEEINRPGGNQMEGQCGEVLYPLLLSSANLRLKSSSALAGADSLTGIAVAPACGRLTETSRP